MPHAASDSLMLHGLHATPVHFFIWCLFHYRHAPPPAMSAAHFLSPLLIDVSPAIIAHFITFISTPPPCPLLIFAITPLPADAVRYHVSITLIHFVDVAIIFFMPRRRYNTIFPAYDTRLFRYCCCPRRRHWYFRRHYLHTSLLRERDMEMSFDARSCLSPQNACATCSAATLLFTDDLLMPPRCLLWCAIYWCPHCRPYLLSFTLSRHIIVIDCRCLPFHFSSSSTDFPLSYAIIFAILFMLREECYCWIFFSPLFHTPLRYFSSASMPRLLTCQRYLPAIINFFRHATFMPNLIISSLLMPPPFRLRLLYCALRFFATSPFSRHHYYARHAIRFLTLYYFAG